MEMINRNRTNKVLCVDLEISAAGAFDSPTMSIRLGGVGGENRAQAASRSCTFQLNYFNKQFGL